MFFVIFFFQFVFLGISSKYVLQGFFVSFLRIIRNKRFAVFCVWLFFLPGVIIHELSHLLFAGILLVPVHKIEFKPILSDSGLKLGSVEVVKTDKIRQILIGVAPLLVGAGLIVSIIFYGFQGFTLQTEFYLLGVIKYFSVIYCIFVISNTMFSSKKDIEGLAGVGIGIGVIVVLFWIFQKEIVIGFLQFFLDQTDFFKTVCVLFSLPVGLNILCIIGFYIWFRRPLDK